MKQQVKNGCIHWTCCVVFALLTVGCASPSASSKDSPSSSTPRENSSKDSQSSSTSRENASNPNVDDVFFSEDTSVILDIWEGEFGEHEIVGDGQSDVSGDALLDSSQSSSPGDTVSSDDVRSAEDTSESYGEGSALDPWEHVVFAGECPGDPSCESTVFVDVSAGMFHSCALMESGEILCWGMNDWGQSAPPEELFARVACGWEQTCGILLDGRVSCWGLDSQGQSSPPENTNFVSIEVGRSHACGVLDDQTLLCWGEDHQGMTSPPPGEYKQVSLGRYHTCALRSDGEAVCFGDDSQGAVSGVKPGPYVQIISGRWHSCGLLAEGNVECWGSNTWNQWEAPDTAFLQIDGGWTHTCGLNADGMPECWGEAHQGLTEAPMQEAAWSWISAGDGHNCGLNQGKVFCWGTSQGGQILGPGITGFDLSGCEELDCDDNETCTWDYCVETTCFHAPVECDDGDPCTGLLGYDYCDPETGECAYPLSWDCDDGEECTNDLCDGGGGCSHTPNNSFCDDGVECTINDHCIGGVCESEGINQCLEGCVGEPVPPCTDSDPCTDDYCDPALGCIHESISGCP